MYALLLFESSQNFQMFCINPSLLAKPTRPCTWDNCKYKQLFRNFPNSFFHKLNSNKGLVPQLWPNYTGPVEPAPETVPCNEAWMKCGFREGCRFALENYNLGCLDLVKGKTDVCNTYCKHSLIALMSTHEGRRLMKVIFLFSTSIWVDILSVVIFLV